MEKYTAINPGITEHEAKYVAFVENAVEGIWRIDFLPPISLGIPKEEQIVQVFERGTFTEANHAAATIYGFNKRENVIGRPLRDFMDQSVPENIKTMTKLVQNHFCARNLMSFETNKRGNMLRIVNNIFPAIQDGKVLYIWGASLDITEIHLLQEELDISRNLLIAQKTALEEKNAALKELIAHIEADKKEYKERIIANFHQVILPSLDKISSDEKCKAQIENLKMALQNLTSTFGLKVADRRINLTPREIEVCDLVKNGLTSKEIARTLNIALHTVEKHRLTARKKLGLTSESINLRSYLSSL